MDRGCQGPWRRLSPVSLNRPREGGGRTRTCGCSRFASLSGPVAPLAARPSALRWGACRVGQCKAGATPGALPGRTRTRRLPTPRGTALCATGEVLRRPWGTTCRALSGVGASEFKFESRPTGAPRRIGPLPERTRHYVQFVPRGDGGAARRARAGGGQKGGSTHLCAPPPHATADAKAAASPGAALRVSGGHGAGRPSCGRAPKVGPARCFCPRTRRVTGTAPSSQQRRSPVGTPYSRQRTAGGGRE